MCGWGGGWNGRLPGIIGLAGHLVLLSTEVIGQTWVLPHRTEPEGGLRLRQQQAKAAADGIHGDVFNRNHYAVCVYNGNGIYLWRARPRDRGGHVEAVLLRRHGDGRERQERLLLRNICHRCGRRLLRAQPARPNRVALAHAAAVQAVRRRMPHAGQTSGGGGGGVVGRRATSRRFCWRRGSSSYRSSSSDSSSRSSSSNSSSRSSSSSSSSRSSSSSCCAGASAFCPALAWSRVPA